MPAKRENLNQTLSGNIQPASDGGLGGFIRGLIGDDPIQTVKDVIDIGKTFRGKPTVFTQLQPGENPGATGSTARINPHNDINIMTVLPEKVREKLYNDAARDALANFQRQFAEAFEEQKTLIAIVAVGIVGFVGFRYLAKGK